MNINYKISPDGRTIETVPMGVLDLKKIMNYFDRLKCDNRIKENAIEIVYFSQVSEFMISKFEIEEIPYIYQKPKMSKKIKATIFVCETALAYGISRVLQTFHEFENPDHVVEIVRSENELDSLLKELKD